MTLELADLGRDRPPHTTELERAAEVCDSGSDLSESGSANISQLNQWAAGALCVAARA